MTDTVSTLMQRARAHHQRGELEQAGRLYDEVLTQSPTHADALHLTGVIAHQQGRGEEAVALITRAIDESTRIPAFHSNLGLALASIGRIDEAETAFREALALEPDFSDALLNLGNLCAARGQLVQAVELLERFTTLDAGAPQGHYMLGLARLALDEPERALTSLEHAVELGADISEVHTRIGDARMRVGDASGAVSAYARALDAEGGHLDARQGLLVCLNAFPLDVEPELLEATLAPLLRAPSVNPRNLGHAVARLLERKYGLEGVDGDVNRIRSDRDRLLDDAVARRFLRRAVNVSVPIETLLTRCRAEWLADACEDAPIPEERLARIAVLAVQCFLNEYVWAESDEERRQVDVLEQRIVSACTRDASPEGLRASALLAYACYRPLWRIGCARRLRDLSTGAGALDELLRTCLHEPLRERDAYDRIVPGAAVRDRVSKAVQAQYEENPYPRWTGLARTAVQNIEQRVQRWCPDYVAPDVLRGALDVLVAGCGTGMDAVDAALHIENAEVTAIDLSRASLAYATRRAEDYGLENVHFRQQDILELDADGPRYHVVFCNGVLHHMRDARAGLKRLVDRLIPGGVIKLALYSRIARAPLMQVRESIHASGLGARPDDIRVFRQRVFRDGAQGAFAELMGSTDFFSTSMCRDLLFHVHETQVTLPELRDWLDAAGLEFIGFELPIAEVERGFRSEYPDAEMTDLETWDAYEQNHPESFRGMYHFWCRKPGS